MQVEKRKFEELKKQLQSRGYQTVKSIGKGAFGEVLLVRKGYQNFAVKVISKIQIKKKPFLQKYIDQQIQIMKKLSHPNIVKVDKDFTTNDYIVIVMQYCEEGNLLTFQSKAPGKTFKLSQALKILVQVMKGLKNIHQKNFIHRDIKSENVLIKKVNGERQYKIADFGFARSVGQGHAKTHCGTEKYMAPQILSNSYYGVSVDIWALGVLFYFMLFAEYPFKGHDPKVEIQKKCLAGFNLQGSVSKKDKLKDLPSQVDDFFKKLFVIDPKKRLNFCTISEHPLFADYKYQFVDNTAFYAKLQKQEKLQKDEEQILDEYGMDDNDDIPEDQSRSLLLKKKSFKAQQKYLETELQEINFEVSKVLYLKECAIEMFDHYSAYLTYSERLAARFYLLKAFLFYADPLCKNLQANIMPQELEEVNIKSLTWIQCTKTEYYKRLVNKLKQQTLKCQILYEDTYSLVQDILNNMPIKNFEKGYTLAVTQTKFDQLKLSYRSTTSHIFKSIHQNKKMDPHLRNKIKLRLFCCHMINRIFNRKEIKDHFPYFVLWLENNKIKYNHKFDFIYFKKWIHEETQSHLEQNITKLHKAFF